MLYELGSVEKLVHGPSAAEHLREALARTTDVEQRVQTRIELARALFFSNEIAAGAEAFAAAIAELPETDSELRRRALAGYLFVALFEPRMLHESGPYLEQAGSLDLTTSTGGKMLLAVLSYLEARNEAGLEQAVSGCRLALEGEALFEEEDAAFYSLPGLVFNAADLLDESEAVWARVHEIAQRRGSIFAFAAATGFRSRTRWLRGSLEEAADDARTALEAAIAHGLQTGVPYAVAFLVEALTDLGSLDAADEALANTGIGVDVPESGHFAYFLAARGRLRLAQGRLEEGLHDLDALSRIDERLGTLAPGFASWRVEAALARHQLGEDEAARAILDDAVRLARAWAAPRPLGRALRASGLVVGGEAGLELLGEAVSVLADSPALLERARASIDLGTALRRGHRRSEAREHLRRGVELAEICGSAPLAEHASAELATTGARLRTVTLSGVDSLTASERRVADMAREGLTNRQIAQALFVTPKTVEVHLSSVYRKLGIASRNDLGGALGAAAPAAARSRPRRKGPRGPSAA